eukprot:44257-Eustigmatos_ZCMA.PRE.1
MVTFVIPPPLRPTRSSTLSYPPPSMQHRQQHLMSLRRRRSSDQAMRHHLMSHIHVHTPDFSLPLSHLVNRDPQM